MATWSKVVGDALEKIDTQLKCSICSKQLKNPKLLPCFHVFCNSCLENLSVDQDTTKLLTCPTCHHTISLNEGGVDALPTDSHAEHLFEIQEAFSRAQETDCEKCKKSQAMGYCCECKSFVCKNCSDMHKIWRELAAHKILTMHEVRADTTVLIPPKQSPRCSEHPNKKLKLYCNSCSKLICSVCSMNAHKGHRFELFKDAFSEHKQLIISNLEPIKEKLGQITEALAAFEVQAREIGDQKVTVEADIIKEIDELHKLLDQRKEKLLQNLEIMTKNKLKDLSYHKENVRILKLQMSICLEYAKNTLENGTEAEILNTKSAVISRAEELTKKFDESSIQPQIKADIKLAFSGKDKFLQEVEERICTQKVKPEVKRKPQRPHEKFKSNCSPPKDETSDSHRTEFMIVKKVLRSNTLPACDLLTTADISLTKRLDLSKSIQLYAACKQNCSFKEFKKNGSLHEYILAEITSLTMSKVANLASQIAEMMACLEEHGYIHRDLALRNFVVGESQLCLLGQLAHTTEGGAYEASTNEKFAIKWTAPEAMFQNRFTIKSDVWSFGILLYELVTFGRPPYPGMNHMQVIERLKEGYRMAQPIACPNSLFQIMQSCWNEDPAKRPTFETLQWQLEEFHEAEGDYELMAPLKNISSSSPSATSFV